MAMLLFEPRTVKELAAELGVPVTRLYYHVRILEKHGLVHVVERRMVSGIEERRYQIVDGDWNLAPGLTAATLAESGALKAMFGFVHAEMQDAMRESGDQPVGTPESAAPVVSLTDLVLTPAEVAEVQDRLTAIMLEFGSGREDAPEDARSFHFLFVGYPTPGPRRAS
jgi:DNA-binding transcriptional ArsR family regulator